MIILTGKAEYLTPKNGRRINRCRYNRLRLYINLLAPDFFFILAHPVYKMWIIQEPNTLELWNKLHF